MNDITITEAVGQLRRIHREFQSFEKALSVAEALNDADKRLKDINAQISSAENHKAGIVSDIEALNKKQESILLKIQDTEEALRTRINEIEEAAKCREDRAKLAHKAFEDDAAVRVDALKDEIKKLSNQRNGVLEAKSLAEKQLNEVRDEIKQTKQAFIESL